MKREVILKEMDKIIYEENGHVTFRTLAANLGIAPATISYQFNNVDNLYKEYLKYKLRSAVSPQSISSFENLMVAFGEELYHLFQNVSKEITFDIMNALIGSVVLSNFSILDSLYKISYGEIDREKEIAIMSNVIIAMSFPVNYSQILKVDLLEAKNRKRLITNIIKREVTC